MTSFWRRIERINEALAMLALGCLVGLPFLQVILRDFFSAPIVGLEEATRWGLIALVYLALPLLLTQDGQIRFPELVSLLPRALRLILERATLALTGLALAALVWASISAIMQNRGTRTPTLDIPFWLFALPFLIGMILTAIGCFWLAVRRAPPPIDGSAPSF